MKLSNTEYQFLKKSGLKSNAKNLRPFAEACFNSNSYNELKDFINSEIDETDLKTWNISGEECRDCKKDALELAMHYFEDEYLN